MAVNLKNHVFQVELDPDDYRTGTFVTSVPSNALPSAQATVRYLNPPEDLVYVGHWHFCFREEDVGPPTVSNYARRLDPGDPASEEMPPKGQVWAFADADANGPCSVYISWRA